MCDANMLLLFNLLYFFPWIFNLLYQSKGIKYFV